jgi:hypothetical protein
VPEAEAGEEAEAEEAEEDDDDYYEARIKERQQRILSNERVLSPGWLLGPMKGRRRLSGHFCFSHSRFLFHLHFLLQSLLGLRRRGEEVPRGTGLRRATTERAADRCLNNKRLSARSGRNVREDASPFE